MRVVAAFGLMAVVIAGRGEADPAVTVAPSLTLQEAYNGGGSTSSIATQVIPGIGVNGQTAHTTINFTYQPTLSHYDDGSQPDRIDHNLNSTSTITLLPNTLTADVVLSASDIGSSANSSNQQNILTLQSNRVLTYIGRFKPHYQTQIADLLVIDATYNLNSGNESDESPHLAGQPSFSSDTLQRDAELTIGSVDALRRANIKLDFKHGDTTGSGANTRSISDLDTLNLGYHVTRALELTGSTGYQALSYPTNAQQGGFKTEGLTWSVGATYTPNELSTASIGYSRQEGAYSPSFQVNYALGPRTKITGSYLVSVQTQLSSLLNSSQFLTFNALGMPIDSRTGLPFNFANQSFGAQNILFRDKPAILSIAHDFLRSSITLTATYEARDSLSGPEQGTVAYSLSGGYNREFSPLFKGGVNFTVSQNTSTTFGRPPNHSTNLDLGFSFAYSISNVTTATITESYFTSMSDVLGGNSTTEQLLIGLQHSF